MEILIEIPPSQLYDVSVFHLPSHSIHYLYLIFVDVIPIFYISAHIAVTQSIDKFSP